MSGFSFDPAWVRTLYRQRQSWLGAVAALGLVVAQTSPSHAQLAPNLGTAADFAVLGGQTVTNTGSSVLNGNLGVSPGSAITGFPPGILTPPGVTHAADAVALGAQTDLTTAYLDLLSRPITKNLTGLDLGGQTLTQGVYKFDTAAQLTGSLTLDAQGNNKAVFIFQIGSKLTTATASTISVINLGQGGQGVNAFWQVGSSATIGDSTTFLGNILAYTDISLDSSATICGRALARGAGDVGGAVTMIGNTILDTCPASVDFGSHGFAGAGTTLAAVPEPGTVPLLCMGLFALTLYGWKSRKRVA
jgi:hypothetical protein